jgi:hypothetical protein
MLLAATCDRPFTMASALAQKVWLKFELRACTEIETENQLSFSNCSALKVIRLPMRGHCVGSTAVRSATCS